MDKKKIADELQKMMHPAISRAAKRIAKIPPNTGHIHYLIVRNSHFDCITKRKIQETDNIIIAIGQTELSAGLTSKQWNKVESKICQLIKRGLL